MQETHTDPSIHVDPEALAELIDGTLDEAGRRELMAHLDQCDDCRELFADAVDLTDEPRGVKRRSVQVDSPQDGPERSRGRERKRGRIIPFPVMGTIATGMGLMGAAAILLLVMNTMAPNSIEDYHSFRSQDASLADQTGEIVRRLLSAGQLIGEREPKHLVITGDDRPVAFAVDDGILVSAEKVRALFEPEDSPAQRKAKLAFVLAHELVHVSKGHGVRGFDPVAGIRGHPEEERFADQQGFVLASLAGFDVSVILEAEGFFSRWVDAANGDQRSETHPRPEERIASLRETLDDIAGHLVAFRYATRCAQRGDFETARALFAAFAERYPSREVFNNLGVVTFRQAAEVLADCDGRLVTQWRIPVVLDPHTMIDGKRLRGQSPCYDSPTFRTLVAQALDYYGEASKRDPGYLPARVNRVGLEMLRGELDFAWALATQLPETEETAHIRHLAAYAARQQPEALEGMQALLAEHPEEPALLYNLSEASRREGRLVEARALEDRFLQLESVGPFAARIRNDRGLPKKEPGSVAQPPVAIERPLMVDHLLAGGGIDSAEIWRSEEGEFALLGARRQVLVSGDRVIAVRQPFDEGSSYQAAPDYTIASAVGPIRFYGSFAVEPGWIWFFEEDKAR